MTKTPKIIVTKEEVIAKPRKLTAKWTVESIQDLESKMYGPARPSRPKRPLTREEEADEIIRRLSAPPTPPRTLHEELADALAEEISKEIDNEITKIIQSVGGSIIPIVEDGTFLDELHEALNERERKRRGS